MIKYEIDFLVIGSGIAGLSFAINVSNYGNVAIVTKKNAEDTNTNLAQGGIASVFSNDDSFELHIKDTLKSGGGICDKKVVKRVVTSAPDKIKRLIEIGVGFSHNMDSNSLDLGREGGHSRNRIVHAQDMTGREIERALLEKARKNKNIFFLEKHIAIDLITSLKEDNKHNNSFVKNFSRRCHGAYVLDLLSKNIKIFISKITLIASGGAGNVYLYTSNPDIATGDGVAMGYRAGAIVANLEFVQFHPTCLYHSLSKNFLISEAVRGEGGILLNSDGIPFMQKYDTLGDLACRDVVARAIDNEIKVGKSDFVYLDISHVSTSFIINRFPNLYEKCLSFGIDMTKDPIPVVPAAHYMCGGILTDIYARTNIECLYAVGEAACTGLHGANRLASNSLLEALVYADSAVEKALLDLKTINEYNNFVPISLRDYISNSSKMDLCKSIYRNFDRIRRIMWNCVGIIRSNNRLKNALIDINLIRNKVDFCYKNFKISPRLIELRNLAIVSKLIVESAYIRKESRGLHYNLDYKKKDSKWGKNTLIQKEMFYSK